MTEYEKIYFKLQTMGMAALPFYVQRSLDTEIQNKVLINDSRNLPVKNGSATVVFTDGYANLSRNGISRKIAPLFVAAHLDFSLSDLHDMMIALSLTPAVVAEEFTADNSDPIDRPVCCQLSAYERMNAKRFDSIIFLQKVVQAWCIFGQDVRQNLKDVEPWLSNGAEFALAVMSLNIQTLSIDQQICNWRFHDKNEDGSDEETLKDLLWGAPWACIGVKCDEHLPGQSMDRLLAMSGMLNDHVLRKRGTETAGWELFMLASMDYDYLTSLLSHTVLTSEIARTKTLKQLFMSLDFAEYEDQKGGDFTRDIGFLFETLAGLLKQSHIPDLLQEEAFLISFFTHAIGHDQPQISFLDSTSIESLMEESQEAVDICVKLTEEPGTLFERLMASQARDPEVEAPANHFLLWGRLKQCLLAPQTFSAEVVNHYLLKMAHDFQTFKYAGVDGAEATLMQYEDIAQSMGHLVNRGAHLIDYAQFRGLGEPLRTDLALWGLDHQKLNIEQEAVVTRRLEIDLGL